MCVLTSNRQKTLTCPKGFYLEWLKLLQRQDSLDWRTYQGLWTTLIMALGCQRWAYWLSAANIPWPLWTQGTEFERSSSHESDRILRVYRIKGVFLQDSNDRKVVFRCIFWVLEAFYWKSKELFSTFIRFKEFLMLRVKAFMNSHIMTDRHYLLKISL